MADPSCGYTCVVETANRYLASCDYNVPCVCRSQDYFNAVYSCISSVCSAADIQAWNQIAENDCEAYGATFPTFPASGPASTAIVAASTAPVPASTVAVTSFAPTTIISTAVVVAGSTITTAGPASQTDFFGAPVTSGSALPPGASSQSAPLPTSQSTSSGSSLSTGAIVGIALGAVGVILLALIAGILFWRRRRTSSGASRVGGAPHDGGELAIGPQGDSDKEAKSAATYTTVTGVENTTGPPPKEPAISDPHYITPNSASELPGKEKTALINSQQPPASPTPAYSQIGGPLPPEIDTPPYRQTAYSPPHGAAEVDSRTVSPPPVQQHISELGPESSTTYYELPTSIGPATWAPP